MRLLEVWLEFCDLRKLVININEAILDVFFSLLFSFLIVYFCHHFSCSIFKTEFTRLNILDEPCLNASFFALLFKHPTVRLSHVFIVPDFIIDTADHTTSA